MFQSEPIRNSIDMSVYVEVNVAEKPLHCPIKLTGIDPETTIYINRSHVIFPFPNYLLIIIIV